MFDQGIGVAADGITEGRMLGLWYDPERLLIEGIYCDEVTAYRARRRWIEALKVHFLLEDGVDFSLKVRLLRGNHNFKVQCRFITACGRYAFWRLTHHQALEVQCILETAHLARTLCSVGVDAFADEADLALDEESIEQRGQKQREVATDRTWNRAVRTIQHLAHKIVGLTRGSSRAENGCREKSLWHE